MTDGTFRGRYGHSEVKQVHEDDYERVIERARKYGVQKFLYAAGYYKDALESLELCQGSQDYYATIGVHPCRANDPFSYRFDGGEGEDKRTEQERIDEYFSEVRKILAENPHKEKIVAIGECGLDYDRFEWADKDTQLKVFPRHFDLTEEFQLPMYLHSRATGNDFVNIVRENRHRFPGGVVHSFTGTEDELNQLLELDLYIGLNGCSLKTEENCKVAAKVPLDRLMLETDCPYCDIRNTHFSM